jgi:hypothetical protein
LDFVDLDDCLEGDLMEDFGGDLVGDFGAEGLEDLVGERWRSLSCELRWEETEDRFSGLDGSLRGSLGSLGGSDSVELTGLDLEEDFWKSLGKTMSFQIWSSQARA